MASYQDFLSWLSIDCAKSTILNVDITLQPTTATQEDCVAQYEAKMKMAKKSNARWSIILSIIKRKTDWCAVQYRINVQIHLIFKLCELSFVPNISYGYPIILNFAQSTAVSLPCTAQNFKKIGQSGNEVYANEPARDLRLRCVSDRYPYCSKPKLIINSWVCQRQ